MWVDICEGRGCKGMLKCYCDFAHLISWVSSHECMDPVIKPTASISITTEMKIPKNRFAVNDEPKKIMRKTPIALQRKRKKEMMRVGVTGVR